MTKIDVIASTDYGYRVLWTEREYLMRLAAVPVLVKMVCFGVLMLLGWEKETFKLTLVMLPSFLVEGWMLAHVVRLVFFGQRWPFRPSGNAAEDEANLRDRAIGVSAGAVAYTLMKFILSGLTGLIEGAQTQLPPPGAVNAPPPDPGIAFAALLFLIFSLWAFKYLFYYIPVSAGESWRVLRGQGRGFITSIQIIGVWLVTFVPWMLLLMVMSAGVISLFHQEGGASELPAMGKFMLLILQILADTAIALVTTIAISHAVLKMIYPDKN